MAKDKGEEHKQQECPPAQPSPPHSRARADSLNALSHWRGPCFDDKNVISVPGNPVSSTDQKKPESATLPPKSHERMKENLQEFGMR